MMTPERIAETRRWIAECKMLLDASSLAGVGVFGVTVCEEALDEIERLLEFIGHNNEQIQAQFRHMAEQDAEMEQMQAELASRELPEHRRAIVAAINARSTP